MWHTKRPIRNEHYLSVDQTGQGDPHLHSDQIEIARVQVLQVGEQQLEEDHHQGGVEQAGLRFGVVGLVLYVLFQFVRVANQVADQQRLRKNRYLLKAIRSVPVVSFRPIQASRTMPVRLPTAQMLTADRSQQRSPYCRMIGQKRFGFRLLRLACESSSFQSLFGETSWLG